MNAPPLPTLAEVIALTTPGPVPPLAPALGPCLYLRADRPGRYASLVTATSGGRPTRQLPGHRYVFTLVYGPVPAGHVVDHLCHNLDLTCPGPARCLHLQCVAPDHLDATTQVTNVARGRTRGRLARGVGSPDDWRSVAELVTAALARMADRGAASAA
jgi:hypothetical protein